MHFAFEFMPQMKKTNLAYMYSYDTSFDFVKKLLTVVCFPKTVAEVIKGANSEKLFTSTRFRDSRLAVLEESV